MSDPPAGEVRGSIGIFEEGGRFAVVANQRDLGRGHELCWDLPGGTPRRGESLADACAREVREETGIPVEVGELAFMVERFGFLSDDPQRRTTYFFFLVERTGAPIGPRDPDISDVAFRTVDEMRALCTQPYHREFFAWLESGRRRRYFSFRA